MSKHTKKANGMTEKVALNPDGSIKQSEFRRILSELVSALKADKDFSAEDIEGARQMAISDVNDAFGYDGTQAGDDSEDAVDSELASVGDGE